MSTIEAKEKRRKYMRDYNRRRYREDPDYRERVKASSRKSAEKRRGEGWIQDAKVNIKEIYGYVVNNCQACNVRRRKRPNGRTNIDFHHLSKEAYGHETPENTAILCFKCHYVANLLERYFGFFEKEKMLKVLRELRKVDPVRNIRETALTILNESQ